MDSALLPLLPEAEVGAPLQIEPISLGLSGAGVYAVTTSRGTYVLRVQGKQFADAFGQQLRVLRRAAAAGVAPAIVHVDESALAVVSERVKGAPLAAAMANPAERGPALSSIVDRLRTLHALDPSDVGERDPLMYARTAWNAARERPGFPAWAASTGNALDAIAETLAPDRRRVVSHNDVNPVNVLWDGTRAWLVDWEVAGLGHPYYDLATLALFLRLDDEIALQLCAAHDGAPLNDTAQAVFRASRKLAGLLCGLTFLGFVDDLTVIAPLPRENAPTLSGCYQALRAGKLDMQSPLGRATFGQALLAESL